MWRGSAIGVLVGATSAIAAVAAARLFFATPVPETIALALGLPVLGALAGALVARMGRALDRRGTALVLDKVGETDERLITALHLTEIAPDDPRTRLALGELDDVSIDSLSVLLPVRWPHLTRLTPVLLGIALALVLLPAGHLADLLRSETTRTPLSEAGDHLLERLAEIEAPPEAPVWPEDIERRVEELAEDMRADRISDAEAATELDQLAKSLEALRGSQAETEDALDALEESAKALDEPATRALKEAQQQGDPQAVERAAEQLERSLSQADPQTRSQAADAMRQAGRRLGQSGEPGLQGLSDALSDAADSLENGQISQQQARQLAEQLQQARATGEQMARDREALERAQRLAGAIEGARQQLGQGNPAGQSSQQGDGDGDGDGDGNGQGKGSRFENEGRAGAGGEGQGGAAGSGSQAGAGHTWEDQGERPGGPAGGGEGSNDRSSEREEGQHIDDFEKLYEAVRLAGAESVVAGTNSRLHEAGRVDELEYRLTTAEEAATTGRVDVPEAYKDAASAAIDAEPIPPAYRNAVRDYFGEIE